MKQCLILIALLSITARGAQVLQASKSAMAVSHNTDVPFVVGDDLCVVRDTKKIACGKVTKSMPKGALVKFTKILTDVKKGDEVIKVGARTTASSTTTSEKIAKPSGPTPGRNGFGGGFMGGVAYQYTVVFYERALTNTVSLRLEPNYFSAPGIDNSYTMRALGGKLGLSYDSNGPFSGLWINVAGGYYSFTHVEALTGIETPFGAMVASATLGYRIKLGPQFALGIAVGGQYLQFPAVLPGLELIDLSPTVPIAAINLSIVY